MQDRAQILLKSLIERYIHDGQPVGSRTLSRQSGLQVSPATVRNVMADLEEMGLVTSPHTSAGRVPTAAGYRYFVDSLLTPQPLGPSELAKIRAGLSPAGEGDLWHSVSALLSSLSAMAGVVTVPRAEHAVLRQVEFLPLSDNRVLAILVINEREVENRILNVDRDYSQSELERAANFLNDKFAGHRLPDIRKILRREIEAEQVRMNNMILNALSMAEQVFDPDQPGVRDDYVLAGQTNLMGFQEFASVERLRALFESLQQKRELLFLFESCLEGEGVQVFIGDESSYEVLDDCSVVTATYSLGGEVVGTLGVIGPTRMAYSRIIPLVDTTARLLGAALENN